jgi:hypothetical protein
MSAWPPDEPSIFSMTWTRTAIARLAASSTTSRAVSNLSDLPEHLTGPAVHVPMVVADLKSTVITDRCHLVDEVPALHLRQRSVPNTNILRLAGGQNDPLTRLDHRGHRIAMRLQRHRATFAQFAHNVWIPHAPRQGIEPWSPSLLGCGDQGGKPFGAGATPRNSTWTIGGQRTAVAWSRCGESNPGREL